MALAVQDARRAMQPRREDDQRLKRGLQKIDGQAMARFARLPRSEHLSVAMPVDSKSGLKRLVSSMDELYERS